MEGNVSNPEYIHSQSGAVRGRVIVTYEHFTPGDNLPCASYIRPVVSSKPGFCIRPDTFQCLEVMKRKLPFISYPSLTDFIACRRRVPLKPEAGSPYDQRVFPGAVMQAGYLWANYQIMSQGKG